MVQRSSNANCRVLELGYGTGLIAFLTYLNSLEIKKQIDYTSLEAYPISIIQLKELNYDQFFKEKNSIQNFEEFSKLKWELKHQIAPNFSIIKRKFFEKFKSRICMTLYSTMHLEHTHNQKYGLLNL